MFSRFAVWLRRNNALSRTALGEALIHAYSYRRTTLDVIHLNTLGNMSDFLSVQGNHLNGCMAHRHFRLLLDKNGKVLCQARSSPIVNHQDEPWQGLAGDSNSHELFLGTVPDLLATMVCCPCCGSLSFTIVLCCVFGRRLMRCPAQPTLQSTKQWKARSRLLRI